MQIREEKLAVAGHDWDTIKENLTILEGEPIVAVLAVIQCHILSTCVAQLSKKESKCNDEIARLRQVHQKEVSM